MQPNEWPNERTQRLIEMYKADQTIAVMAETLAVTDQSVESKLRRLRRAGQIEPRNLARNQWAGGRATLEELAAAYNACGSWIKVAKQFGYARKDNARLRYYTLLKRAGKADQTVHAPVEAPAAPVPLWRDMGKGAQAEYARALERVERMVAAGDDRSAAINQVAQETGVRVR